MKKRNLIFIILLISYNLTSQIAFEKGYYLDLNGEKIEGYIKNEDWANSPNFIIFKKNKDDLAKRILAENINEFKISGISKFRKFKVKIYKKEIKNTRNRSLTYTERYLLLNNILEGEVSLYFFHGNTELGKTFLVEKSNGEYLQLINFKVNIENKQYILNSTFRSDLEKFLSCKNKNINTEKLKYNKKSLAKYIDAYNNCFGVNSIYYQSFKKNIEFHVIPKVGVSYNNFFMKNDLINFDETLNGFGYSISTDLEFSLPFNNKKWSVIIEPTYTSNKTNRNPAQFNLSGIQSKDRRFQLGFGARKYFTLNENNDFYTTFLFLMPVSWEINVDFSNFTDSSNFSTNAMPSLNIGYKINDKIFLELNFRYSNSEKPFFDSKQIDFSTFTSILSFGYKVF